MAEHVIAFYESLSITDVPCLGTGWWMASSPRPCLNTVLEVQTNYVLMLLTPAKKQAMTVTNAKTATTTATTTTTTATITFRAQAIPDTISRS